MASWTVVGYVLDASRWLCLPRLERAVEAAYAMSRAQGVLGTAESRLQQGRQALASLPRTTARVADDLSMTAEQV